MANNLLTVSMITREAVPVFVNSNAFIKNLNRQYDGEFGKNGEKIGSQLRIRLPNDYTVTDGPALSVQDTAIRASFQTLYGSGPPAETGAPEGGAGGRDVLSSVKAAELFVTVILSALSAFSFISDRLEKSQPGGTLSISL